MKENKTEAERRKIQLDIWLRQRQMTKRELAAVLGVTEHAVYGWCSNANIPEKRWGQIKELFGENTEVKPGHIAVDFTFTEKEWAEITAGMPDGIDKEEAVKQKLLAFIRAAHIGR
ncbi:MAG: hypothetical protein IKZ07_05480 [Akkermansia sp.]|nr:hypothetical protein [Akkermansia sp.]